ncbi:MAG: ROK family protein [Azospirillaceae bacterium]|nr:ROK family protein [Azospirillaceae bacterium]
MFRIGIDLGGTKIEGIVLDRDGRAWARRRIATPRDDYDGTIAAIRDLVLALEREVAGTGTVGVGIPGALSPATGMIKNANSRWLNGRPLDRDLTAALARPVRLQNDANCFAVSEATDGAAAGHAVAFAVILGTGCGGGIAIGGRPLTGHNAIAGEWGHTPLPWMTADEYPGPACYCGHCGCIESWLCGPGMAADHQRHTGETVTAADIAQRSAAGDAHAAATLDRYVDRLARALSTVVNILDPDIIVLGGGVSNITALYDRVPPLLRRAAFSDQIDTPILRAQHGDSSGVRGAAWLWPLADEG